MPDGRNFYDLIAELDLPASDKVSYACRARGLELACGLYQSTMRNGYQIANLGAVFASAIQAGTAKNLIYVSAGLPADPPVASVPAVPVP